MEKAMPEITYILRFTHRDRDEIEDYEHASESDARYHFGLFDHTDADIYSRIELIRRNWRTGEEKVLTSLILPEPDAFK